MKWYYAEDGQQRGPVDEDTLKGMLNSQLPSDIKIWCKGQDGWLPASTVFDLSASEDAPADAALPSGSPGDAEPVIASDSTGQRDESHIPKGAWA